MLYLRNIFYVRSTNVLTGCTVGSDYRRPDAALSKQYLSQSALMHRDASPPTSFVVWRKGFNDLSLNLPMYDALAQNLNSQKAQIRAGFGTAMQAARALLSVEIPLGQSFVRHEHIYYLHEPYFNY